MGNMHTVNDLLDTRRVNLILEVQEGTFKGAVSRLSRSFCLILPITRSRSVWNLK